MSRKVKFLLLVLAAVALFSSMTIVALFGVISTAPIVGNGNYLTPGQLSQLNSALNERGANGETLRQELETYLSCQNLPPGTPCYSGDSQPPMPIPSSDLWLIPIWQRAAQKYDLSWQLLAAINAARTNFGQYDCDTSHGNGFLRIAPSAWAQYGVDAGHSDVIDQQGPCWQASAPTDNSPFHRDGEARPADAVDAIFSEAKMLHAQFSQENADGTSSWQYSGDAAAGCMTPQGDGRVYSYDSGSGYANVGSAPSSDHPLPLPNSASAADQIPGNYLVLYLQAAKRYNVDWAILAAIGRHESDFGQLQGDGPEGLAMGVAENTTNSAGAAGPMQFNLYNTWNQPSRPADPPFPAYIDIWTGNPDDPGLAYDYNHDGQVDVWDPRDAIPAAAADLRARLTTLAGADDYRNWQQTKDAYTLAVASYNAGTGAVELYGGIPPIPETQNYVKEVLQTAQMYTTAAKQNPAVIDELSAGAGDPNPEAGGGLADIKGSSDPVSQAVSYYDGSYRMSNCYVANVYAWYQAIEAMPSDGVALGGKLGAMVAIARSQLGTTSACSGIACGSATLVYEQAVHGQDWTGSEPWCADFVSWAALSAGIPVVDGHGSAGVAVYADWAANTMSPSGQSLLSDNIRQARPGDLILFGNNSDHIGIIESVTPTTITTLEGNSGPNVNAVTEETYSYNYYWISGIIRLTLLYS